MRRRIMASVGCELPPGARRVSYIEERVGTDAYLKLGIYQTTNVERLILDFEPLTIDINKARYCGAYDGQRSIIPYPNAGKLIIGNGNGLNSDYNTGFSISVGMRILLDVECRNGTTSFAINGTHYPQYNYGGTVACRYEHGVFGYNENANWQRKYPSFMRLFSMQQFDDDVLKLDLVPVVYNGIGCVFDRVRKDFIYSSGPNLFDWGELET